MGIITIGDVDDSGIWEIIIRWFGCKGGELERAYSKNLRAADYVTTTTPLFAKRVRQVVNKNVEVVPNALNPYEPQFSSAPLLLIKT